MNKFGRLFFITLAANVAALGLGLLSPGLLIVLLVAVPIELLVGLCLVFFKTHRETGAALLVVAGVILLIAGFICSSMSYNFH